MGGSIGDLIGNVLTFGALGQKQAQKKAQDEQRRAEMEARRIQAEKKPMEETATLGINTGIQDNTLGSLGLMVNPDLKKKQTTGLGTTAVSSTLGFGS